MFHPERDHPRPKNGNHRALLLALAATLPASPLPSAPRRSPAKKLQPSSQSRMAGKSLADGGGFTNPSARPHTWWHWMNCNVSRADITADLEAMKRAGIGGAQLFHVDVGLPAEPVPCRLGVKR